jgi:ATP-dependent DNA ligase
VLDGEVVVPREIGGRIRLDWESLSQRIHPAASRVNMLAEQTPAHFIGFDALAAGDQSLL